MEFASERATPASRVTAAGFGPATRNRAGPLSPRMSPWALNFSLSLTPFWGSDIGGFVPTRELTGELYTRWFQFAAFNPLFRSHGRTWHLRLPWGWNTGETGPVEDRAIPDPAELHNAEVEPICRKYLELRYQLLPYNYTLDAPGLRHRPAAHARVMAALSGRRRSREAR